MSIFDFSRQHLIGFLAGYYFANGVNKDIRHLSKEELYKQFTEIMGEKAK